MTKGLLLYPQRYGFHAPSYAYVENLRELGIDMHYGGYSLQPVADLLHYAHHLYGHAGEHAYARFAATLVDTLQPDFVHVFHYRGAGLTRLYSKMGRRVKWIMEVRTVHVRSKRQQRSRFSPLKDRLTWIETLGYDQVIANTETIKRRMSPSKRPIALIPTGASWDHFNAANLDKSGKEVRSHLNLSPEAVVLIYAGSMSKSRDLNQLVTGFSEVVDSYPNAHLLMIGGTLGLGATHDVGLQALMGEVASLGIGDHIHFIGRLPFTEVPSYYAAADIGVSYVPPDTAYETQWPTKLIEIMMAGLIPVTNITAGAREVYQREDAVISCGGDAKQLACAMSRAIGLLAPDKKEQRDRLIANARARGKELDWKVIIAQKLLPLYATLGITA